MHTLANRQATPHTGRAPHLHLSTVVVHLRAAGAGHHNAPINDGKMPEPVLGERQLADASGRKPRRQHTVGCGSESAKEDEAPRSWGATANQHFATPSSTCGAPTARAQKDNARPPRRTHILKPDRVAQANTPQLRSVIPPPSATQHQLQQLWRWFQRQPHQQQQPPQRAQNWLRHPVNPAKLQIRLTSTGVRARRTGMGSPPPPPSQGLIIWKMLAS